MEINRDALLRVVKAARMSMKMADNMRPLLVNTKGQTWADEISGQLIDSLFILSGETLKPGQGFYESNTMLMLNSDNSDGTVADWFIMMDKIRKRISEPEQEVQQPAPQVMSPKEVEKLHQENGGYQYRVWGHKEIR